METLWSEFRKVFEYKEIGMADRSLSSPEIMRAVNSVQGVLNSAKTLRFSLCVNGHARLVKRITTEI